MKAVILAGGLGQRISEESSSRPKPMIEIGSHPILWHIMKIYAAHGIKDFVICLGYKGYVIKDYFSRYQLYNSDLTIDLRTKTQTIHQDSCEDWTITLIDTGEFTMTGGRLKRILPYVKDEEAFCVTYGDAVSDIDIKAVVDFHKQQGKLATVTAVQPTGRFGRLDIEDGLVHDFEEKPVGDGGWINGGFFVFSPKVLDMIEGDDTVLEQGPLPALAARKELAAYKHQGFWRCMDTLRDKHVLEDLWAAPKAPWKNWA